MKRATPGNRRRSLLVKAIVCVVGLVGSYFIFAQPQTSVQTRRVDMDPRQTAEFVAEAATRVGFTVTQRRPDLVVGNRRGPLGVILCSDITVVISPVEENGRTGSSVEIKEVRRVAADRTAVIASFIDDRLPALK